MSTNNNVNVWNHSQEPQECRFLYHSKWPKSWPRQQTAVASHDSAVSGKSMSATLSLFRSSGCDEGRQIHDSAVSGKVCLRPSASFGCHVATETRSPLKLPVCGCLRASQLSERSSLATKGGLHVFLGNPSYCTPAHNHRM